MHVQVQGFLELIKFTTHQGLRERQNPFGPLRFRKAAGTIGRAGTRRITPCGQLAVPSMVTGSREGVPLLRRREGAVTASLASHLRMHGTFF